jgi:hypothetical protein
MAIHDAVLAAVHEHPAPVMTDTVPEEAGSPSVTSVGEML